MDTAGQSYVNRKLAEVLEEARTLIDAGLATHQPRIEALLREALDRVVASGLTLSVLNSGSEPAAFVRGQACSRIGGEPVSEFRLLPFGEVEVERGGETETFTFDREQAEALVAWFEGLGRKLAIDYEHQSLDPFNTRNDGLKPAAGWIGGLEVRDDGLWAVDVIWTQQAAELLARGEYRYFSPVIYWAAESRAQIAALGPVALTNDPALHDVPALAASRQAADAARRRIAALENALREADEELWTLRRQLRAQEAEAFVERGMRLGKIVDATSMDWRADYLRDPAGAEERLSRAPVILPPGRLVTGKGDADQAERRPQTAGLEREDIEAYERALVAGRIQGPAAR